MFPVAARFNSDLPLSEHLARFFHELVDRAPDGSWLIGGTLPVDRMKAALRISESLPGEDEAAFYSVGGFVMHQLNRIPIVGEGFDCMGWQFKVLDMDQRRVDKVLATPAHLTQHYLPQAGHGL